MSSSDLSGLPGFRDFFPDEYALRQHITAVWRDVARRYGCVEYDGPPLEPLELFTRKSGAEIVSQLYQFTDQGGREVALRPEMTPTFARMVGARAAGLAKPIRWFSVPQLFRYERPQKGRLREHFQLNLDVVGEPGVLADVDVVSAVIDVLRAFGLTHEDFQLRVSDRGFMGAALEGLGVSEDQRGQAFAALDKLDREGPDGVTASLTAAGFGAPLAARVAGLGAATRAELEDLAASSGGAEHAERLDRFFILMGQAGLGEFVRFDPTLVRGLAYYTGIVFEAWDRKGEFRAICGGGRYDDLLKSLGGPDLPALGFGMGDVVLGELLKARGLAPVPEPAVEDYVIVVSETELPAALGVIRALRDSGRRVAFDFQGRSVGRQFKAASQSGAQRAVIVGPDELARGEVVVRELETGQERTMTLEGVAGE
ncbi:MAG: histidine--tRNA ligase [Gemmatimonadota bacterium]